MGAAPCSGFCAARADRWSFIRTSYCIREAGRPSRSKPPANRRDCRRRSHMKRFDVLSSKRLTGIAAALGPPTGCEEMQEDARLSQPSGEIAALVNLEAGGGSGSCLEPTPVSDVPKRSQVSAELGYNRWTGSIIPWRTPVGSADKRCSKLNLSGADVWSARGNIQRESLPWPSISSPR